MLVAEPVKTPGAASVPEMLPPKAAQIERIRVEHDRLRCVSDPVTFVQPTVAQLTVLGCREAGVKTADGREAVCRERKVVAGKELRLARSRAVEEIGRASCRERV